MLVCGCFIYFTDQNGRFEILKAVGIYYGHAMIMLFFNIIFNKNCPTFSIDYIFCIFLNSLTSFYSFSHFDFFGINKKHKPTFLSQGIYYMIIMTENIGMTVYFAFISSFNKYQDEFGKEYELLSKNNLVFAILLLQTAAVIVRLIYYANHPSSVSLTSMNDKMQIYILGSSWVLRDGKWVKEKDENKMNMDKLGDSIEKLSTP